MSKADLDRIREHYGALRDGELLRAAVGEGGTLVASAQEVVRDVVQQRLGAPADLVQSERRRTGRLWGRIGQVQTFSRLRGPNEPVLGGRDVPPYDGMILLTDQGLGFVPSSPPALTELFPTLPEPDQGPMGDWWTSLLDAAAIPEDLRTTQSVFRLPLCLRARLDPSSAWIALGDLERLDLRGLDLRVVVSGAGDAVCRVPEPAPEFLGRWGTQLGVTLQDRADEGVRSRVRGWLRRD